MPVQAQQKVSAPVQPTPASVQKPVETPRYNSALFVDDPEDDGAHPSVEKLFANLTAPPTRITPNGHNKGNNNGHK